MADTTVNIVVRARDHASRIINGIAPSALRVAAAAGVAFRGMGRGMVAAFTQARTAVNQLGDGLKRMVFGLPGIISAVTGGALAALGKTLVGIASDADELGSKFAVLFDGIRARAEEAADAMSVAMGRSRTDVREFMSSVQNLLTPMGLVNEEGLLLSDSLARLAIDLASFNNTADDEALLALKSALVGESEPLRRFGVTLTEAKVQAEALTLGLVANKEELSERAKMLARVSIITRESAKAQGDAIRTGDSFANSSKRLRSEIKDLSVGFGKDLIKSIQKVVGDMGGTARVVELVRVGLSLLTGVLQIVIEKIGRFGLFLVTTVEELGGVDEAIALTHTSLAGLGDLLNALWAAAKIGWIGLTRGVDTAVIAIQGLGYVIGLLASGMIDGVGQSLQIVTRGFSLWMDLIDSVARMVLRSLLPSLLLVTRGVQAMLVALSQAASVAGLDAVASSAANAAVKVAALSTTVLEAASRVAFTEGSFTGPIKAFSDGLGEAATRWRQYAVEYEKLLRNALGANWDEFIRKVTDSEVELRSVWTEFVKNGGAAIASTKEVWARISEAMRRASERVGKEDGRAAGVSWMAAMVAAAVRAAGEAETQQRLAEALAAATAGARKKAADRPPTVVPGGVPFPALVGIQAAVSTLENGSSTLRGFADGWREVSGATNDAARAFAAWRIGFEGAREIFNAFQQSVGEIFVEMAEGGKNLSDVWDNLKRRVLMAIGEMVAKMIAMKATQAALQFFNYGGGTGAAYAMGGVGPAVGRVLPLRGAAVGGVTNGPTLMLAGEGRYKREAFVPLPDGRRIPAVVEDRGAGGTTNITFQVNAVDARGFDSLLAERRGMIEAFIQEAITHRRGFRQSVRAAF